MKQPTNLELALCDGMPWGLKCRTYSGIGTLKEINKNGHWYLDLDGGGGTVGNLNSKDHEGKFFLGGEPYPPSSILKPILFSLSCLTKEITISDYNDGKPFIPINVLNQMKIAQMGLASFRIFESKEGKIHVLADFNDGYSVLAQPGIKQILDQWHFNTRNLEPHEFINAEGLNVY